MKRIQIENLYPDGPTIRQRSELVAAGWKISRGIPTEGGFHPANENGGYQAAVVAADTVIHVTRGTAAYHDEVVFR